MSSGRDRSTTAGERGAGRPVGLDRWLVAAVVVAVAPILVAGIRAALTGWYPTGDDGFVGLRAQDVFTSHPPLLGTWSSASLWSHHWVNHPGPAQFVALAVPVAVLGVGAGVAVGAAVVNAASVVLVAWLARRRVGSLGAIGAMVAVTAMSLTFGSEILFDPWNPNAAMLPFVLFLFGVWCVADGDLGVLWLAVVAGSFALQTHLSYVLLVPGLLAVALLSVGARRAIDRRARVRRRWLSRRDRRDLLIGLVTLLVCWSAPLYEQLSASKGNLSELVRSSTVKAPQTPGLRGALDAVGSVVARPPFWLPNSWADPRFSLHPSAHDAIVPAVLLGVFVGLTVGLLVAGWRRGDRTSASLGLVVVVTIALALVGAMRSPSPFGLVPTYVQWTWPIAMFAWFALVVAAARAVPDRWAARGRPALAALGLVVVGAVLAACNLPRVDRGTGGRAWAIGASKSLFAQAQPALRNQVVLVDDPVRPPELPSLPLFAVAPALLSMFESHGIEFVVPSYRDDKSMVRQVGEHREWNGHNATIELSFVPGPDPGPFRGRLIARHVGLSPRDRALRLSLQRRLVAEVRARGGLTLSEEGRLRVRTGQVAPELVRAVASSHDDATALFIGRRFATLVELDALDLGDLDHADLRRYAALTADLYDHTVALVAKPLPR